MSLTAEEKILIREAIDTLRRLAIVGVQKPGIRAVIISGYRCKICGSTWSGDAAEIHDSTCILDGSDKTC